MYLSDSIGSCEIQDSPPTPRRGAPPNVRPMSYREAMLEAERRQLLEYQRLCAVGRLFQPLERKGFSPEESVKRFERRLRGLPRVFQMKREMAQGLADLRAKRDSREITRDKFEFERARREMEFQQMIEREFSPGYILGTEE